MKLVIVESPNKAKIIQEYLGNEYIVLASMGHICDLGIGGKYGIGVDVNNGFKPSYVLSKDKIDILHRIISEAEKSSEILLMSDKDREGESISYHIARYLSSCGKPIKRIEFNKITKDSIKLSIANPREIDINLFRSQEARRILDRIVGFMVSPYLMSYYGSNLSAGRVQSVAVRMIVDREKEIENFIPEEYWNISAKFSNQNNQSFYSKYVGKIINKNSADAVITAVKNDNFYVSNITSQKKKEAPPPPLTTASLQQYMAAKFSFEPDRTMKAAQNLYESGFCTYIRTDSTRMSDEAINSIRLYITENNLEVPKKPNVYASKDTAQDAHECIHPTNIKNVPDKSTLIGDEKDLYKIIWQFAVASQMNSAVWDTLSVKIQNRTNGKNKIVFSASGRALHSKGYLEIFGDVDPGQIDIPNLAEGDAVVLAGNDCLKSEQKFTKSAPRFNNATILKELEDRQIGRPATFAEIIKKITARNYVEKKGSTYRPTELGIKITNILVKYFRFMEYEYTSDMEKQLDEIATGNVNSINMLRDFFIPFKEKLNEAYLHNGGIICEKCGSPMSERTNSKNGEKFIGCNGYPRCMNIRQVLTEIKEAI